MKACPPHGRTRRNPARHQLNLPGSLMNKQLKASDNDASGCLRRFR